VRKAYYYYAETENGDHMADPSEDGLFMLLAELDHAGNTFITVKPARDSAWYASVTLLEDGSYTVERRDPVRQQHEFGTETDIGKIALDLTVWLADRDYPLVAR
jgi:hypothetical protein